MNILRYMPIKAQRQWLDIIMRMQGMGNISVVSKDRRDNPEYGDIYFEFKKGRTAVTVMFQFDKNDKQILRTVGYIRHEGNIAVEHFTPDERFDFSKLRRWLNLYEIKSVPLDIYLSNEKLMSHTLMEEQMNNYGLPPEVAQAIRYIVERENEPLKAIFDPHYRLKNYPEQNDILMDYISIGVEISVARLDSVIDYARSLITKEDI
ncbi:hypothetical protein SP15_241 [Bacillus phage SP-15]|uniref:Uncharacterized protein n=1 Tax=Bacillus phage SP-15 TaxID=1792032 RepID=A0A127AWF3_9CAUD|nr:hypothetical protein SP15_241 [Bacillus phage SP-15]AMM45046.1 hypothetical protein SP15_241 [Bacillus phage SP-15]